MPSPTPTPGVRPDRRDERARMIERQIESRGVTDPRDLEAMLAVPREAFLPARVARRAYEDRALPLGDGQTMSQPYMVAVMTEALDPRPSDRILEVGTGSGYQAAILARLVSEVYTVERLPSLLDAARRRFRELRVENIESRSGDGTRGWPEAAPFDRIVVTAAAPEIPEALRQQLSSDGGRLVIPVGDRQLQRLVTLERNGDRFHREDSVRCRFVPLLGAGGWETTTRAP